MHIANKFLACYIILHLIFLSACQYDWKRTPGGLDYHIITEGKGIRASLGSTVKCIYERRVRDSVTFTNEHSMPEYILLVPGILQPYTISEALLFAGQEGATIEITQRADSMLSKGLFTSLRNNQSINNQWITRIHVLKVFSPDPRHPARNDSLISADQKEMQKQFNR